MLSSKARPEWPPCPDGHDGRVRSHGFRRIKGGEFARPVFCCVHSTCDARCRDDCDGKHYFTGGSQARTAKHPNGLWCGECAHPRTLRDGRPVAVLWDFEAHLIAEALVSVGKGVSYRKAAQEMRASAFRYTTQNGVKVISEWGGSVHRYLDHFGVLVLDEIEHSKWPEVLVLDALPLRQRDYSEDDPFSWEQSGSGAILVAVGYTDPVAHHRRRTRNDDGELVERKPRERRRPHVWKMALSGGYNRWAWFDFLSSLPGTPKWIVVDGEAPVRLAIRMRWGDGPDAPVVFSCEGHFQRKFQERALKQDGLTGIEVDRLWPKRRRGVRREDQPRGPLWTRDDYRRLLDAVLAYDPGKVENITGWLLDHDEVIRRQFDLRDDHPGFPRGTGAVEAAISSVGDMFGERTKVIQNVYRTNITLGLMRAHLGHDDDVESYTRAIRDELERTNGRPDINWREHHFHGQIVRGSPGPEGSLFHLADYYEQLGEGARRPYWVGKQASSMANKLLLHNSYHFLNGYPPLTLTTSSVPSVRRTGLLLRDLPLIRREWDPANDLDPDTVKATYEKKPVGWICHEDPDHRWSQTVSARCGRLNGCPECQKVRGVATGSQRPSRDRLVAVRGAWGEFDEPPVVSPVLVAPAWLVDPVEDF
jgi:hypothetical protein